MAFQFQCPQGHLLEGDESQAGQQCNCPTCGMLFIIPPPLPSAPVAPPAVDSAASFVPGEPAAAEPELLHIPCPNGHELETPVEMLDQEVLCPQCNAQFKLRRKDSVEFKKKRDQDEKIQLERAGSFWLNGAIVAVVLVVLILVGLVVMSQMNEPMVPKS